MCMEQANVAFEDDKHGTWHRAPSSWISAMNMQSHSPSTFLDLPSGQNQGPSAFGMLEKAWW